MFPLLGFTMILGGGFDAGHSALAPHVLHQTRSKIRHTSWDSWQTFGCVRGGGSAASGLRGPRSLSCHSVANINGPRRLICRNKGQFCGRRVARFGPSVCQTISAPILQRHMPLLNPRKGYMCFHLHDIYARADVSTSGPKGAPKVRSVPV